MKLGSLVVALLLLIFVLLTIALLGVFWLPLLLLVLIVGISLWLIRKYHLEYLDEPEARRPKP